MKRQRGYLWLTVLLLAATVLVVLLPRQQVSIPQENPMAQDNQAKNHRSDRKRQDYGSHKFYRSNQNYYAGHKSNNETGQPFGHPVQQRARLVVELNGADSLDLVQLYNIGPVFARRILRYRERLGGFCHVEQLREVYGMDSVRFGDILPYVRVDTTLLRHLDINTATIDQLKRHPYLDYYQAKAIVQLRERRGSYKQVGDLRDIPSIEEETYKKISPYLLCNLPPIR